VCAPAAFEIAVDDSKSSRFDGRALAEYLSAARLFQNPLSRRPLERSDCERLDAYIRKHKLGRQFHVTRDFDEAAAAAAAAAAAGTSEALAAERAAAAEALLHAFFAGGSRGRDARRGGGGAGAAPAVPRPQQAPPALQAEGNFALMDDDAGMLRGRSRGAAEAAVAERAHTSAAARLGGGGGPGGRGIDAFPALPTPAWPTLQSAPAPPRSAAAAADDGSDAARSRPSWWALAAPAPRAAPPPAPAPGAGAAKDENAASDTRRRQLADAFGVTDPLTRPSMFAASSAEAFSAPTLAIARAEPSFVADLESRFDAALAARARRTPLPPMPRGKRRVVHEMAHMYGFVSSSYGEGASRHVDLFVLAVSGCPSSRMPRLSDAARAPPPLLSDGDAAAVGADGAPLQLRFSGASLEASVPRALGAFDGDYTLTWHPPSEAVATFKSEATFRAAAERLGAGLRGIFTVTASGASGAGPSGGAFSASAAPPAAAPSRAEIKRLVAARKAADAAWEDDAPRGAAAGRAGRADEASSWERRGDGGGAVVTLRAVHVPTVNRWGALDDDAGDGGNEGGSASGGSGGGASDAEEAEPADSWDAEPEGADAGASAAGVADADA
jgi:hypothetical protein